MASAPLPRSHRISLNVNPKGLTPILELFYATGIRRTEMTNLDLGDYDPHSQTLHIRRSKGGKSRMLPVGERAAAWLGRQARDSRPRFDHLPGETAMFLSGYGTRLTPAYLGNWIKKLMKRCGIERPGSCHLFRHSCATDMHRGGADIRYVQEMLGHARLETTQIYTHVHIDALREVHARTHPHGKAVTDETPEPPIENASPEINKADFASLPAADSLTASTSMNAAVPPTVPAAKAAAESWQSGTRKPPNDDPPPETTRSSPPKPPRNPTGGNSHNKLFTRELKDHQSLSTLGPLCDYGYRYYDPATGRWPSRDPIGEKSFFDSYVKKLNYREKNRLRQEALKNAYNFCDADPINKYDKDGLAAIPAAGILTAALATCIAPHFLVALDSYPHDEGMRHCWASCATARTCSTGVSALAGLGFEVLTGLIEEVLGNGVDARDMANHILDMANNTHGLACAGVSANLGPVISNLARICQEDCHSCCKRKLGRP